MSEHDCSSERYLKSWLGGARTGKTSSYTDFWNLPHVRMPVSPMPANHGKPWTAEQDKQLRTFRENGWNVKTIALRMGRLESAIVCRMEKLRIDDACVNINSQLRRKEPTMNNLHYLLTLLQKGYTTISVSFDLNIKPPAKHGQLYTYKAPTDYNLKPGDLVVVPVGHTGHPDATMKVARVMHVDDEPKIDPKAPYALKWVVNLVDTSKYDDQVQREAEAIRMIEDGERKAAAETAAKALLELVPDKDKLLALLNGPA